MYRLYKLNKYRGLCKCIKEAINTILHFDVRSYYFFYSDYITKHNFPELFKFKPKDIKDASIFWFNNREERLKACKGIIKLCKENQL